MTDWVRYQTIAKYKGEIPEGKVCLPTCYLFIHIWKLTYWIKKQTFWPLSTESSNSVLWSLIDSGVNFLNIGLSGYKMLIHLGGPGIKILFSKCFGHLVHQVLQWVESKDSPQASDFLHLCREHRMPLKRPEQQWTDWATFSRQQLENSLLSQNLREAQSFFTSQLQKLPLNQGAWMFSLQKTSQGHFLEDCYQKRREQ